MAYSFRVVKQVLAVFSHYTLWLMTDQVNEVAGQVSPEIEKARRAFKPTGADTE